mmetsp:Transcript_10313/g.34132  ORF Transcript_10313/g.34132 Transcript_10313/m.34132 type:complete len:106 (+) Transcript_10313:642-959(+)
MGTDKPASNSPRHTSTEDSWAPQPKQHRTDTGTTQTFARLCLSAPNDVGALGKRAGERSRRPTQTPCPLLRTIPSLCFLPLQDATHGRCYYYHASSGETRWEMPP